MGQFHWMIRGILVCNNSLLPKVGDGRVWLVMSLTGLIFVVLTIWKDHTNVGCNVWVLVKKNIKSHILQLCDFGFSKKGELPIPHFKEITALTVFIKD